MDKFLEILGAAITAAFFLLLLVMAWVAVVWAARALL